MSKAPTSGFLGDFARDLRERRLLIPVVLLLAALVAVPVLLSESADPAPAPAPPATDLAKETSVVEPAVLAQQSGIRDYRKRLAQFKRHDPFKQRFVLPEVTSESDVDVDVESGGDADSGDFSVPGGDTGGGTFEPPSDSTGGSPQITPDPDPAPAASDSGDSGDADPGSTANGGGGDSAPRTIDYLVTHSASVSFGPVGDLERDEDVRQLDVLRDGATPILVFLGASLRGERATFFVAEDVQARSGEGRCVPSRESCDFVTLLPGEAHRFRYEPSGETFRLKLLRIREHLRER